MSDGPLLEVVVTHAQDAEAATEGGADRLVVAVMTGDAEGRGDGDDGTSPRPAEVSAVHRSSGLPVRVLLRASEEYVTSGAEIARLRTLADAYLAAGAEGFVLGFLTPDNRVDADAIAELLQPYPGVPWTFHRAVDHVIGNDQAWREIVDLPGLDAILTAGSVRGLAHGLDEVIRRARDPRFTALVLPGGGLRTDQVPWLAGAGVTAYQVGAAVRDGGSWRKSWTDAGFVRSWRSLLDARGSGRRGRGGGTDGADRSTAVTPGPDA